jgi:hypothetical protein
MSVEHRGGMISTGENSWFVHNSFLAILPSGSSNSEAGGTDEGNEFCLTKYLFDTSKGSLTCRKTLRHGADDITSLRTKVMLLKNTSPRLGLKPRTLGPIASTLTTRPKDDK